MLLLHTLSSLKVTLSVLMLFAATIVAVFFAGMGTSASLALPMGALSANLLAAILVNKGFRRQVPLLVFHLALLALVMLAAAGRLTYLTGSVELSVGEEFAGRLTQSDAGPLHALENLQRLRFTNLGFDIDYAPGPLRQGIRNRIELHDANRMPFVFEATDQKPLMVEGYRFYPTGNKGFAPTFAWQPAGSGAALVGTVHLPSYPLHALGQAREWTPPGAMQKIWVMLEFDEVILLPDAPSYFRPPRAHRLVVRLGERRHELQPGDSLDLPEGRLVYQGVGMWMGYSVFYDWTIPWLLASSVVAIGAMGMHFWNKFAARPWQQSH